MPDTPVTWLDDFVVNVTTGGEQSAPRIVHLANGNILVVWASANDTGVGDPPSGDVIGQIFTPLGEPIGSEFLVNNVNLELESAPDIGALPDGGFLTVYSTENIFTNSIILTQRDAAGALEGTVVIKIDSTPGAAPSFFEPGIAVQSSTSALVIYRASESNGDSEIRGVIYNSETRTFGTERNIFTSSALHGETNVTAMSNGNYVIVGQKFVDSENTTIVYAIVDADGTTVLSETPIFETLIPSSNDREPSVAALTGGGFVVSYTNTDDVDTDVVVQIFDNDGFAVDGNLNVNGDGPNNNNGDSDVVAMSDGGFVVFYVNGVEDQIEGQRYTALGIEVGDVFVVSTDAGANTIDAELMDDGRVALGFRDGAGESRLEIIDTRDETNAPAYAPDSWQIGTPGDDIIDRQFFAADNIAGGAGNDTLSVLTPAASYFGGTGDDTFIVQSALTLSDLLDGGSGIDTLDLSGRTENYNLDLASGDFFLDGFARIDVTRFENVTGTSGDNGISGTNGANRLDGFNGNDSILGEGGADTLNGGAGDDTLDGGNGFDQLFGGRGSDSLGTITQATGLDDLNGGTGIDRVVFALGASVNLEINLARNEYSANGFESSSLIAGVELIRTGDSSDRFTGNSAANVIESGAGDDILFGGGGDDFLAGDTGNNTISGGAGNDILSGTTGTNRLSGNSGNDTFFGGTGTDTLFGGTGADQMEGLKGADQLFGGGGNDILVGGDGRDSLFGGFGRDNLTTGGDRGIYDAGADDDVFLVTSVGRQTLIGGDGADVMDTTEVTVAITMDIDLGTFNVTGRLSGFETISLGSGDDIISGSQIEDTVLGGDGRDSLAGLGGNDVLRGLGGNDTVSGFSGADALFGGADADEIFGGSGDDTLQGGSGNDRLTDSTGNDTLSGEDGDDILQGGDGVDVLFGGFGNDRLFASIGGTTMIGGDDIDTADFSLLLGSTTINLFTGLGSNGRNTGIENVVTGSGDDTVAGSAATNILRGNAGADTLNGGGGIDRLFGGADDDRLQGGAGADIMSGGAGNDTYIVNSATDRITEIARQGNADQVLASASFDLAADDRVEVLATLNAGGRARIDLSGNAGSQAITGNAGANTINGEGGTDILTGRQGSDHFVFDTTLGPANVDRITDFNVPTDTIDLDNAIFTQLRNGDLSARAFHSSDTGQAADASDRIIYDTDSGDLFYDRNGDAAGGRVRFATLDSGLSLTHQDFLIL